MGAILGPDPLSYELEVAFLSRVPVENIRATTTPQKGLSILNPNYKE